MHDNRMEPLRPIGTAFALAKPNRLRKSDAHSPEEESDWPAVHTLNVAAFGSPTDADLVDRLRKEATPIVSFVAVENKRIIGHVVFSPVMLSGHADLKIMGLAPLAVSSFKRNQGIGSFLARAGLEQCNNVGFGADVVPGHPAFCRRIGFSPAKHLGLSGQYDVLEDYFLLLELQPGYLHNKSGTIKYYSTSDCVTGC